MADIQIAVPKGRRKTAPPRVDFTPMVDLGFILITFFLYTTTMAEAKSLELNKPFNPPPPGTQTCYADVSTITIIPTANHILAYYNGSFSIDSPLYTTDFKTMRDLIISKKSQLKQLPATYSEEARQLHVIIKPDNYSTYEDMVAILDEMLINKVEYYALTDITEQESAWVKKKH